MLGAFVPGSSLTILPGWGAGLPVSAACAADAQAPKPVVIRPTNEMSVISLRTVNTPREGTYQRTRFVLCPLLTSATACWPAAGPLQRAPYDGGRGDPCRGRAVRRDLEQRLAGAPRGAGPELRHLLTSVRWHRPAVAAHGGRDLRRHARPSDPVDPGRIRVDGTG